MEGREQRERETYKHREKKEEEELAEGGRKDGGIFYTEAQ